ncbi:DUF4148 domain-containing protein [Paraburkholderia caribensis]|jgi:hypothetical protein|uniref:DUF4148 domain-containing protein n=1 Tax=Paraburkholderia caribensis TaxID=75105 RepID=UPI001590DEEB|nr:DUF4148 domain-containing protein [Paraburkholderia caribensis]
MKTLINTAVVAIALIAPVASFAQSTSTVTRAQVRQELVALERAGYHVGDGDQTHYPEAIMAAEAKVSSQAANTGVGGVTSSSQSGSRVSSGDWNAMYSR